MLDPMISLSFAVNSSKGVYALLLGSGLSRSANIPTGWEITLDLIRRSAAIHGEDCEPDPDAWYRSKYEKEPDYSELLNSLGKTPADRANMLGRYFEPTVEANQNADKTPTRAHQAIARMVSKGYFRVIITTNFDRLLERALESQGVSPTVISSTDTACGALPLAHSKCTLIKVHGDYRDTRIKNTVQELTTYEPAIDTLLDRIFDEYGLIVCGWSAAWDHALRNAITRCASRRFSLFWAVKGALGTDAEELIKFRHGTSIRIDSADQFMVDLENKLDALERYERPHPLSVQLAIVTLKKFIAEDRHRIELRDLVMSEADRQFNQLKSLPMTMNGITVDDILERMKRYETAAEALVALMIHGCYWGKATHRRIWSEAVVRMGGLAPLSGGNTHLLRLRKYPMCLMFYAGGISSIASGNYEGLRVLARDTPVLDENDERPLVLTALPWSVLDADILRQTKQHERQYTPVSNRIHEVLREPLRDYLPNDRQYDEGFDRFEYLTALSYLDLQMASGGFVHAPVGRYGWKMRGQKHIVSDIRAEQQKQGSAWPPIASGLFESEARFLQVQGEYEKQVLSRVQWF